MEIVERKVKNFLDSLIKQSFGLNSAQSWHSVDHQSISPMVRGNQKPGQLHYASKLNGFVWAVFCNFTLGQKLTVVSFHDYVLVILWQN